MSSSVKALQGMNDLKEVMNKSKEKLVILEFMGSKTYSTECKDMKPKVEEIAKEKDAYFYTIDVDIDQFKDYAEEKKLQALPIFFLIKDTKEVKSLIALDKDELSDSIDEASGKQIK